MLVALYFPMFRANFNTKTLRASIHAAGCRRVSGQRKGEVHWDVACAQTAQQAAQIIYSDQDFEIRGLEFPKICECCK